MPIRLFSALRQRLLTPLVRLGGGMPVHQQAALRESEQHFRAMYELAPLAYQSLDAAGGILDVNAAWLELFQRRKEDVLGRFIGDYLSEASQAALGERFASFKRDNHTEGNSFRDRPRRRHTAPGHGEWQGCARRRRRVPSARTASSPTSPRASNRNASCVWRRASSNMPTRPSPSPMPTPTSSPSARASPRSPASPRGGDRPQSAHPAVRPPGCRLLSSDMDCAVFRPGPLERADLEQAQGRQPLSGVAFRFPPCATTQA
ncbi:MAG: PAS domain-containing protein [Rhodocyclaceae bacterium]|nr:PAS domain-containing protein [Rhodocyclaceae bacterium]